jgi:hypothetical protein
MLSAISGQAVVQKVAVAKQAVSTQTVAATKLKAKAPAKKARAPTRALQPPRARGTRTQAGRARGALPWLRCAACRCARGGEARR